MRLRVMGRAVLPATVMAFSAGLLVARGHAWLVVVLGVAGFLALQLAALSPAARRRLSDAPRAVGRGLATTVNAACLAVVFVLFILPGWVVVRLRRRDLAPLRVPGGGRWTVAGSTFRGRPRQMFEVAPRPPRGRLARAGGVILLLLVADLVLGALLGVTRLAPGPSASRIQANEAGMAGWDEHPAMRGYPWASEYAADMIALLAQPDRAFVPLVVWQQDDFQGEHIHVEDGVRRSYRPPGGSSPLRIALLGGSTMFGVGQRDSHTIPSQLARIAQRHGIAIEAVNLGVMGYSMWQEFLTLEHRLGSGEHFDLAVFYDGVNDVGAQDEHPLDRPNIRGMSDLIGVPELVRRQTYRYPGFTDGVRDLLDTYLDASATGRVWHELFAGPVTPPISDGLDPRAKFERALRLYERGRQRVVDLAADHDLPVVFYWQPQSVGWPPELAELLSPAVRDLTHALDGVPPEQVYIDTAHTNERGATLVAQAMWSDLRPRLASLAAGADPPPAAG